MDSRIAPAITEHELRDFTPGMSTKAIQTGHFHQVASLSETLTKDSFRKKLKIVDSVSALLAVTSLIIAYSENNNFYKDSSDDPEASESKKRNESTDTGNSLRGVNMLVVTFLLLTICLHYYYTLNFMKFKGKLGRRTQFKESGLFVLFMLELASCCTCTPPYFDFTFKGQMMGYDYTYSYNLVIFILMLTRTYLIFRLFAHYSRWTSRPAEKICKTKKVEASVLFAVKSEFASRPYFMICFSLLVLIIVFGVAVSFLERPYESPYKSSLDFKYETNGMWLIIITMSTVGYGDGFPSTHLGRVVATLACIFGMVLFSLTVVSLSVITEFSPQENKAYIQLRLNKRYGKVENKAADVIKTAVLFSAAQNVSGQKNRIAQGFIHLTNLVRAITKYKNDDLVASNETVPATDILYSISRKLSSDVKEICLLVTEVGPIQSRLKELSSAQLLITRRLDSVFSEIDATSRELIQVHNSLAD
jgi:hypothetical protein